MLHLACLVIAALLAGAVLGCDFNYVPPARIVQYGAPGRVQAHTVEIGAGVLLPTPAAGSLHVAYGLTDWAAVEGGGSIEVGAGSSEDRGTSKVGADVMGWLGPRFSLPRHRGDKPQLIGDIEIGLGAGFGGSKRQAVFGGYQGLGAGLGVSWFSLFLRGRIQESASADVPTMYWPSGMVGLGFDLDHDASTDVGVGGLGIYSDSHHYAWIPFGQLGFTWRFGGRRQSELRSGEPRSR